MSAAEGFARWALTTAALEEAIRRDLPPAQIADMLRVAHEATEALLRGIVATVRHNDAAIIRAATIVSVAQIDAETRMIWRRIDAHAARLARIEAALAEAEAAEGPP